MNQINRLFSLLKNVCMKKRREKKEQEEHKSNRKIANDKNIEEQ